MADRTPPLSYLIRESQRALLPSWQDILQHFGLYLAGPPTPGVEAPYVNDADWTKTHQQWTWHVTAWDKAATEYRHFTAHVLYIGVDLDPEAGEWNDGTVSISDINPTKVPTESVIFDNRGRDVPHPVGTGIVTENDGSLVVRQTRTVTLQQSRTVTATEGFKVDVGGREHLRVGAGSTVTGVAYEQDITEAFGWHKDTAEAQAESHSTTETVDITTRVAPGEQVVADLFVDQIKSAQPIEANGPWTGGVEISVPQTIDADLFGDGGHNTALWAAFLRHAEVRDGQLVMRWGSLDELADTLSGFDTDRPGFTPENTAGISGAVARITARGSRLVHLRAMARRSYQANARYVYSDAT